MTQVPATVSTLLGLSGVDCDLRAWCLRVGGVGQLGWLIRGISMGWRRRWLIVVESDGRVRVAWWRGRAHLLKGIVVSGRVVSPVCVKSYFVIIIKGEGAVRGSRHAEYLNMWE